MKNNRNFSGKEFAWRFRIDDGRWTEFDDEFYGKQRSCLADWSGDFVIGRAHAEAGGNSVGQLFQAAYQLAVVVDDHRMGITEVIRGDDLMASTHRQLMLYESLGWKQPRFLHLPLVVGPDGRRLAKRHGDTRIASLRSCGISAEKVVGWLAFTCGLADPGDLCRPNDLLRDFSLDKIPRNRVILNPPMIFGDSQCL